MNTNGITQHSLQHQFHVQRAICHTLIFFSLLVADVVHAQSNYMRSEVGWSTFLGGEGDDKVLSITTDGYGFVYVAGRTTGGLRLGNDTTGQSGLTHQRQFGGGASDAFLAQFAPQGSMLWCTYFGGAGDDEAVAVVLDGNGGVYLVGNTTSTDSIATDTLAYRSMPGGGNDIFIAHFTEFGLLNSATYFGGSDDEFAGGASLDGPGDLLICGHTNGPDCLAGIEPAAQSYMLGNDGLLLRFDGTSALLAGTFIGGEGDDKLVAIAQGDGTGTVFAGNTTSSMNIAMMNAMTDEPQGGVDAFLMKVDTSLTILYGSYFGGAMDDLAYGVAQYQGSVAICGLTRSDTLYADSTSFQPNNRGGGDGFVAVFDSSLTLSWSTYFGDTAYDALTAVAFGRDGDVYASGYTASAQNVAFVNGPGATLSGPTDALVLRFDSANTIGWSRYLGGMSEEETKAMAVFGNTYVYVGGRTASADNFAVLGHQMAHGGGTWDGYTTRMVQERSTAPAGICTGTSAAYGGNGGSGGSCNTVSPPLLQFDVCLGQSVQFMAYGGALGLGAQWMWYANECGVPENFLTSGDTITITPTASFVLKVRYESAYNPGSCSSLPIIVHAPPTPIISVTDTVCAGAIFTMQGTNAADFSWQIADSTYTGPQVTATAPTNAGLVPIEIIATGNPVCSVTMADSILVLPPPTAEWTTTDITCHGGADGSITLDSTSVELNITWEPATYEGATLIELAAGTYIATSLDQFGCTSIDTLSISMPVALMDSVITTDAPCGEPLGSATLFTSSTASGLHFEWSHGPDSTTMVDGLSPGLYTVTAMDSAGCTFQLPFIINDIGSLHVSIGADTLLADDGSTTLTCMVLPPDDDASFTWSPAFGLETPQEASTLCKVYIPTLFTVSVVSSAGCLATDSVLVIPIFPVLPIPPEPCGEVFLADIFSPNGDGLNDKLCLLGGCFTSMDLSIYDRWGQRVFNGTNIASCWDGTLNGTPLPAGAYAFALTAERSTGDVIERSGTIDLRR